jgi:hypothetical protein
MAAMMPKLYAALIAANAPEDKAREAAEEAANIERGLDGVRNEIALLRTELKGDNALLRTELKGENTLLRTELKGEIRRLEWLLVALLGVAGAVAGKYFLQG